MILNIILQVVCAFMWFWFGVTTCNLYMKKDEMKKKEESLDTYTIYEVIKARGSEFILQGLYDGKIKRQGIKSLDDQIMDSLRKHAGDGVRHIACGFAVTRKCYSGEICLTILDNDFTNIVSFFI